MKSLTDNCFIWCHYLSPVPIQFNFDQNVPEVASTKLAFVKLMTSVHMISSAVITWRILITLYLGMHFGAPLKYFDKVYLLYALFTTVGYATARIIIPWEEIPQVYLQGYDFLQRHSGIVITASALKDFQKFRRFITIVKTFAVVSSAILPIFWFYRSDLPPNMFPVSWPLNSFPKLLKAIGSLLVNFYLLLSVLTIMLTGLIGILPAWSFTITTMNEMIDAQLQRKNGGKHRFDSISCFLYIYRGLYVMSIGSNRISYNMILVFQIIIIVQSILGLLLITGANNYLEFMVGFQFTLSCFDIIYCLNNWSGQIFENSQAVLEGWKRHSNGLYFNRRLRSLKSIKVHCGPAPDRAIVKYNLMINLGWSHN
ncbi:unnamed protein product [Allacma fusca]|uniref:Odorant receptor n=1 Tax=Allacma fusca TaxID=39272 RepID=A0A8J2KP28_9HEXA|nr:unnamed protein product [Allacma fusca]